MDIVEIEIESGAETVDASELMQLGELELALVGGGNGIVLF